MFRFVDMNSQGPMLQVVNRCRYEMLRCGWSVVSHGFKSRMNHKEVAALCDDPRKDHKKGIGLSLIPWRLGLIPGRLFSEQDHGKRSRKGITERAWASETLAFETDPGIDI